MRIHPLFAAIALVLAIAGLSGLASALGGHDGWLLAFAGITGAMVALGLGRKLR